MKNPWIVSLAALGISLAAFVALLLRTAPTTAGVEATPVVPTATSTNEELLARVDALVEENLALRARVASLELRPVAPERTAATTVFATQEDLDAFREEVRAALDGRGALAAAAPTGSPEFKEQVATTLSEIRKDEAVQKVRAGLEQRSARLDEAMPKYTEWLGLSTHQSNALRVALEARYEREAELVRLWEEGGNDEALGERKRGDHETFVNDLGGILTPEQLQTYQSRGGGK